MSSERAGEPIATRPFIGVLLHHKRLSLNTPNVGEEQRGLPGETVDKELHAKERPGGNAGADHRGQPRADH